MKRLSIIAVTVLLFTCTAELSAQTTTDKKPKLGINAGYNFSKFAGDPDPQSSTMEGFGGGLFVNFPIGAKFSVEPSVEYSDKGAEYMFGTTKLKQHLGYIDVPVKAVYNLFGGLNIFAGPQLSFVVDKYIRLAEGATLNDNALVRASDPEAFNDMVFGAKGGLNYNFGAIGIIASYATDLQDMYKEGIGNPQLKNEVINVGVKYTFK